MIGNGPASSGGTISLLGGNHPTRHASEVRSEVYGFDSFALPLDQATVQAECFRVGVELALWYIYTRRGAAESGLLEVNEVCRAHHALALGDFAVGSFGGDLCGKLL